MDDLAARPDVDPNRIGVIGWCMGGGYALKLATADRRLRATAVNYGSIITDPAAIARINSQILGSFGGADRGIPEADVKKFAAALTQYGKLADIKIYDNAGHAFMNPNNKQGYDAARRRTRGDGSTAFSNDCCNRGRRGAEPVRSHRAVSTQLQ